MEMIMSDASKVGEPTDDFVFDTIVAAIAHAIHPERCPEGLTRATDLEMDLGMSSVTFAPFFFKLDEDLDLELDLSAMSLSEFPTTIGGLEQMCIEIIRSKA